MIVLSVWFAVERPPEAKVEGNISRNLPLVCQIPLEVVPLNEGRSVNAVFVDVEHLRLAAGSRDEDVGEGVIGQPASWGTWSRDGIPSGISIAVNGTRESRAIGPVSIVLDLRIRAEECSRLEQVIAVHLRQVVLH